MAITYPLALPTHTKIQRIELSAVNAVAISQSPFTFSTQVHSYSGERWDAVMTLPPMRRTDAEKWNAFFTSLRGPFGTFLLGDTSCSTPRGTATAATITGTSGSRSVTVAMTGTLLAGDYIQLGTGSDATLHKVLEDQSNGGTLEIWPALRKDRTGVAATLTNARGLFRLTSLPSWSIDGQGIYSMSFSAQEAIT